MQRLRSCFIAQRAWFALLLACALAVRIAVPVGFMPSAHRGGPALTLCSGTMPAATMGHHRGGGHDGAAGHEAPCAFAGIGLAVGDGVPPAFAAAPPVFSPPSPTPVVDRGSPPLLARLRPPLRAPPRAA